MERELEMRTFRAHLESIIQEVLKLRSNHSIIAKSHEEMPGKKTSTFPILVSPSSEIDLMVRVERAREIEEKNLLTKLLENTNQELERTSLELKRLKSENEELTLHLSSSIEESLKDKSARNVMATLIDTLRANHDELSGQLKDYSKEAENLLSRIKQTEDGAVAAISSLRLKNEELESLKATIYLQEQKEVDLCTKLDEVTGQTISLSANLEQTANDLIEARRLENEAKTLAQSSLESALKYEKIALADRAGAKAADDHCVATAASLKSVILELENARTSFDEERASHQKELTAMSEADDDAKTRIRALKSSLDEEILSRKMIENDRDVLREMLEKNTKEKLDAEKAAKRACDDLRILNTKHERLLQAQRAATSNPYTTPSFDAVVNPVPKRSANGPSEVFNYSPATPEDCRKVDSRAVSQKQNTAAHPRNDICPICSEIAYGLMALCQNCGSPFHSLCLPPHKRTLGVKFLCDGCAP